MAEKILFEGKLLHYGASGYEGVPWALTVTLGPDEDSLQILRPGDHLTVTDAGGEVVHESHITIGQGRAGLLGPYWYPNGISKEKWARMFNEEWEHSARLRRGVPNSIAKLVGQYTTWRNLLHIESYTPCGVGHLDVSIAYYFPDPKRKPTRLSLWFVDNKLIDFRPL